MIGRMRSRTAALSALVPAVLAAALLGGGCGGSGSSSGGSPDTTTNAAFEGAAANPPKPAPPLKLDNYLGDPVNLNDYRGKAVFVTFVYVHCPDVCPVIISNFRAAQEELGPEAKDAQFIAVSVDPDGDTPETVAEFLKARQMTGRMQYLVGSRPELEPVWHRWNVVSRDDPKKNIPDYVEHSALIYGISGSGKITTLYPADFKPEQIVHDAPLLAAR
jgi:protein SCO1/2